MLIIKRYVKIFVKTKKCHNLANLNLPIYPKRIKVYDYKLWTQNTHYVDYYTLLILSHMCVLEQVC